MFAMARDNNLPFSRQLGKVDPVRKTPTVAAIVIGLLAIIPLIVNISQPAIFTILSSISIVLIYFGGRAGQIGGIVGILGAILAAAKPYLPWSRHD